MTLAVLFDPVGKVGETADTGSRSTPCISFSSPVQGERSLDMNDTLVNENFEALMFNILLSHVATAVNMEPLEVQRQFGSDFNSSNNALDLGLE